MTYCTQQDLIDRFGEEEVRQLSDHENTGFIDDSVVARAIADSAADVESHLAAQYTVPLDPVPSVIRRIACDLARYYLYDNRVTETVQRRYDDAMKTLALIRDGKVTLGIDEADPQGAGDVETSTPEGGRCFTRDSLEDF